MRMLGLFMVLPVLALYGADYRHATPFLLGLALGAYGLSQALLQIPFGWWSDRWGRKPVIALGLVLFALGSVIAAASDSVYGLILGRFLQGSGAIASALLALVADATEERHRSKAMASIGIAIGLSFSVAIVLGPIVTGWGGLEAIFWLTAALALFGLLVLFGFIPTVVQVQQSGVEKPSFQQVLRDKELLRLDGGVFVLHLVLMANFVAIPSLLENVVGLAPSQHWWVYLPVVVGAFVAMLPAMLVAERFGQLKVVFLGSIALLVAVEVLLVVGVMTAAAILFGLFLFFVAFNLLEATLPSQVSKMAPSRLRGAASGVYSSSQFAGAFAGGTLGGAALALGGAGAVFGLCAVALSMWLLLAWPMVVVRKQDNEQDNEQDNKKSAVITREPQAVSEPELESV